jgi:hypothetical protein
VRERHRVSEEKRSHRKDSRSQRVEPSLNYLHPFFLFGWSEYQSSISQRAIMETQVYQTAQETTLLSLQN